jgi:hypothetical protein
MYPITAAMATAFTAPSMATAVIGAVAIREAMAKTAMMPPVTFADALAMLICFVSGSLVNGIPIVYRTRTKLLK